MKYSIIAMFIVVVFSVTAFGAGAKDVAEGHINDRAVALEAVMNY